MARRSPLLVAGLAVSLAVGWPQGALADGQSGCSQSQVELGTCTSGNSDGTGVNVVGVHTSHRPGHETDGPEGTGTPLTDQQLIELWNEICFGNGDCGATRTANMLNPFIPPPLPGRQTAGGVPRSVTASDVARFLPALGALHTEPREWAVVGVPANFWVEVQPATVDGELLGAPAQVRFTPQAYRWQYGDGTTRTTTTPGASWAQLGQTELTTTATSHVYTARGDLRVRVEVVYSAEYRVGGGEWLPVVGAVFGSTPAARMLVVTERTVLTAGAT